jgi:hypothetical protein
MRGASIVTPFFIWFYLLVALVLFVNLLIAMFNAEFEHVMAKADANVRLAKVHQVQHCKRLSPPFTSSLSLHPAPSRTKCLFPPVPLSHPPWRMR